VRHAVGLAHAGWKGTMLEIAAKTVDAMRDAFGSQPAELIAGMGPAIGPCCFEVGDDVVAPLRQRYGQRAEVLIHRQADGAKHVDLWLANRWQLAASGVTQIETSRICTCCHQGEFPSHRGEKGVTGRFPAVIGLCKR
jgi:polyphenol oxidase